MKIRTLLLALSLMSLNAQAQVYNYDVNDDGEINVQDVTILVDKILGEDHPLQLPMYFSADQEPLISTDGPAYGRRRTQETTIQTLKEFYINYTFESKTNSGFFLLCAPELRTFWQVDEGTGQGRWLVGDDEQPGNGYWPSQAANSSKNVKFYAYANVDIPNPRPVDNNHNVMFYCEGNDENKNGDVSKPYIHFMLDENGPATKDLLVAKVEDNWNHCKGHIFFHFEHACAALQFFLIKTERLDNFTVNVKNVVLYNVMNDGNYYFNPVMTEPGEWKGVKHTYEEHPMYYTLWAGNSYEPVPPYNTDKMWQLTSSTNKESDYFFFIPQEFPTWSITENNPITANTTDAYIELECQILPNDNGKSFEGKAYLPFVAKNPLVKGYAYPVIIQLGTSLVKANGKKIFAKDQNNNLIIAE